MPLKDEQRAELTAESKTWIGTPYRGWSCVKGAGTDCGQFIYGVYRNCGHVPEMELPKDYSLEIAKHQESTEYVDFIARFMREIPESEVKPGDVAVWKLGKAFAHAAIVVEWSAFVIHCIGRYGVSGAHGTKFPLFRHAERKFFTLKDEWIKFASKQKEEK